jgi:hypothetical protein
MSMPPTSHDFSPRRQFASVVFVLLFSCAGLLLSGGCAHYQLGTGAKLTFRTLYVEPVANKTMLPQTRALLSTQLRETFLRDSRVELVNSAAAADATLTVTIADFHREEAAVREGDTGLARKFNLVLGATCTLRDNRTAKNLFENRTVTVRREAFTDSGQLQAEYQTLPLLAESLSAKILHAALDVW